MINEFYHVLIDSFCAARISGSKLDAIAMEELNASSSEDNGILATHLNQIKRWLLSHSQHLNFFTILVLASVSVTCQSIFSSTISLAN